MITTLEGPVTFYRDILVPNGKDSAEKLWREYGVKSVCPLDDALGVSNLPFKMTPAMMLRCAYWAQNEDSYQGAEDIMKDTYGFTVNDDTIRLVTNFIGKQVFEEDCRKTDEFFKEYDSGNIQFNNNKDGILFIETDGADLNSRYQNAEGSTWRENKLGIIFSSDNIHYWTDKHGKRQHQIEKREYVPYLGSVNDFERHLLRNAVENGYGQYRETVLISDGGEWIDGMAKELFPDAVHILDIFHSKQNIYDFAKSKFSMDKSKYTPWAEHLCKMIEDGKAAEVLAELDPDERYDNCVNLYHYIYENIDHMNYPEYKKKGYFCGSGAIESANKIILRRLKQAGMRWDPMYAQYLLTLICKWQSGYWQRDVVDFIKRKYEVN